MWHVTKAGPVAAPFQVAATRQLAKRQTTWLRGMPARTVIAADAPDAAAQAVAHALRVATA